MKKSSEEKKRLETKDQFGNLKKLLKIMEVL